MSETAKTSHATAAPAASLAAIPLRFLDLGAPADGKASGVPAAATDDDWEELLVLPPPPWTEDPLGEDDPDFGHPENSPPAVEDDPDYDEPPAAEDDPEYDEPPLVLTPPSPSQSQATQLVDLAMERGREFLRSAQGVPYARIRLHKGDGEGNVQEVEDVVLMSEQGTFRDWLEWEYFDAYGSEPRPGEIKKAVTRLRRQCLLGPIRQLEPRSVYHDDAIWIDAGRTDRTAFRISPSGVETVTDPPTLWWRPNSLGPLPLIPDDAASCDPWTLLDMVNMPPAERKTSGLLLVTSVIMGFVPPSLCEHPLMQFIGPEGSGKSTAADMCKWIFDPPAGQFGIDGRVRLRVSEDLLVVMYNNLSTHLDNVSPGMVTQRVSDELCSAVTGTNLSSRKLCKDLDQQQVSFRRIVLVTGIVNPIRSSDLQSRTLRFRFPMIERTEASNEAAIINRQRYMSERPRLVGACLHRLSQAMAMPAPHLAYSSRLAEWSSLACRVAMTLGATQQQFEESLRANMIAQRHDALDDNGFAAAIIEILATRKQWRGTATELLDEVTDAALRLRLPIKQRDGWPQHPRAVWSHLEVSAASLADLGIHFRRVSSKGKDLIVIEK